MLEGGCSVPLGVFCSVTDSQIELKGRVTSVDGTQVIQEVERGLIGDLKDLTTSLPVAEKVGVRLANVMIQAGAKKLIATKDSQ